MVEYCVYWLENGEPMHEVFSSLAAAEMYSCAFFIAEKRLRHPTKVGKVLDISKDLTYVSRD